MQPQLAFFADIRTGLTLRGPDAARHVDREGLPLLKISDIDEDGVIHLHQPHLISKDLDPEKKFRLCKDDVVVANRGSRITAAIVPEGVEAIASNQLFIVRPFVDIVLPEYLVWFLNLDQIQQNLLRQAKGTNVQTLSIAVLRELEIPIPPMQTQRKLCELAALVQRESRLMMNLGEKRSKLLEGLAKKIFTAESK